MCVATASVLGGTGTENFAKTLFCLQHFFSMGDEGAAQSSSISALIREYVSANPPSGKALSTSALEYTTGRLMLLQVQRKTLLSSQVESTKFAACLFVLFVQECLVNQQASILGFDAGMIHSILLEFAQSVDPDALHDQIALLDEDGAALEMADQPGCLEHLGDMEATRSRRSDQKLGDGGGDGQDVGLPMAPCTLSEAPGAVEPIPPAMSKLTYRMQFGLGVCSVVTVAYAASWHTNQDVQMVSSSVQIGGGEIANNLVQLMIVGVLGIFLSVIAPEDLDSAEARKYIGPLLAVSDVCDTCVAFNVFQAYHASRSEGAAQSYERRVCLYIHYALVAFFYYWGVVYPTMVWFFYKNSWWRLRTGLVIDACVFLTAIGLLWWHGETRYPPGDSSLLAAILGRPTVSLLVAAVFTRENRRRLVEWCARLGVFHVKLSLNELQGDEIRRVLAKSGYGAPVASGNSVNGGDVKWSLEEPGGEPSAPPEEEEISSAPASDPSHHTAKVGSGVPATAVRLTHGLSHGLPLRPTSALLARPARPQSESASSKTLGSLSSELSGLLSRPLGFEAGVGSRYAVPSAASHEFKPNTPRTPCSEASRSMANSTAKSMASDELSAEIANRREAALEWMHATMEKACMELSRPDQLANNTSPPEGAVRRRSASLRSLSTEKSLSS